MVEPVPEVSVAFGVEADVRGLPTGRPARTGSPRGHPCGRRIGHVPRSMKKAASAVRESSSGVAASERAVVRVETCSRELFSDGILSHGWSALAKRAQNASTCPRSERPSPAPPEPGPRSGCKTADCSTRLAFCCVISSSRSSREWRWPEAADIARGLGMWWMSSKLARPCSMNTESAPERTSFWHSVGGHVIGVDHQHGIAACQALMKGVAHAS